MKKILFFMTCAAFVVPVFSRTISLSGDYGCGLFVHQIQRLEAMQIVMRNSMLRANGRETAESKASADKASADMVRISGSVCRPVNGKFKVLESRPIDGGEAIRIEPSKTESLWVLGPF